MARRTVYFVTSDGTIETGYDDGMFVYEKDGAPTAVRAVLKGAKKGQFYDEGGNVLDAGNLHPTGDQAPNAPAPTVEGQPGVSQNFAPGSSTKLTGRPHSEGEQAHRAAQRPVPATGPTSTTTTTTTAPPAAQSTTPSGTTPKKTTPTTLSKKDPFALPDNLKNAGKSTTQGGGTVVGKRGVPIGVPYTATTDAANNTTYVVNYTPPMWIQGQGPVSQVPSGLTGRASFETSQVHGSAPNNGKWYLSGDENAPINTPESIPGLQNQLVAAGLIKPADVTPGLWTATEANAYYQVLGYANTYGVAAGEMLADMAKKRQLPPVKLTPKGDVDALAQQIIPNLIGRSLTNDERALFEKDYGKWEVSQQTDLQQQANPTSAIQPDTQTAPESTSSFATQWAQENLGNAEAHDGMVHALGVLHNLIGAGPGG